MRLALLALGQAIALAQPGIITTVAGAYPDGMGGPAKLAALRNSGNLLIDAQDNLFVAANGYIYRITPDGYISVFAGTGVSGYTGDGGPVTGARVSPSWGAGMVIDAQGNFLFSDSGRIRKISPTGIITTIAGTSGGFSGDGGPAVSAQFSNPLGLALDSRGNIYIADYFNNRVRRIAPDGNISTFAGNGNPTYTGDGGPAVNASLNGPQTVAVDRQDNVYVADRANRAVRKITSDGTITTVMSSVLPDFPAIRVPFDPVSLAFDREGSLYVGANNRVLKLDVAGKMSIFAGTGAFTIDDQDGPALSVPFTTPYGLVFDSKGNFFLGLLAASKIGRIDPAGHFTIVAGVHRDAGANGPATYARLIQPRDVALDANGNLAVLESLGASAIKLLRPSGVTTLNPGSSYPVGIVVDPQGVIYASADDDTVKRIDSSNQPTIFAGRLSGVNSEGASGGDGGPANMAFLKNPQGLALDSSGSLYIADRDNHRIRKVTPDGIINTVAGSMAQGFAGDLGPATSARLNGPMGVAVDAAGNLFIADAGNNRIRKVTPDGVISTIAGTGTFGFNGDGGPAIRAAIAAPRRLAVDAAGNVYFTDGSRVRKVTRDGIISTVAGNGNSGFSGDGGPAVNASLNNIQGLAIDINGNIYVADQDNNRIRKIQGSAPFLVAPASLIFSTALGGTPPSQVLNLSASDGATRKYQVTAGVPWLTAAPATGSVASGADARISISANPAGLKKGTYPGALTILDLDNGTSVQVPVTLTVSGTAQQLRLSQTGLTFTAIQNGGQAPSQTVLVLNTGSGAMPWTVTSSTLSGGASWLAITRGSGTTTAGTPAPSFTVSTVATGLPPGAYYGKIDVAAPSADNSPQSAVVLLNILPSDGIAGPQVNPAGLLFSSDPAATPAAQPVELANLSTRTINYTASVRFTNGSGWLTTPASGSLTAGQRRNIDIQPRATSLAAGVYRATVTFNFTPDNVTRTLDIAFVVNAPPASADAPGRSATCTPKVLVAVIKRPGSSYQTAAGWPVPVEAEIIDDCRSPIRQGRVTATFSTNDPALPLLPTGDGSWQATWASRTTQAAANVTITLRAETVDQTLSGQTTVAIRSDLNPNQPSIAPGGVLNAASFRGDTPVSPGEYVSIFGSRLAKEFQSASSLPLPSTLGETVIAIGGKSAPLHFASDGQVNAILPYGIPDSTTLQMIARRGNTISLPEPIVIATTQPAVFAYDGSGKGQGHIYGFGVGGFPYLADNANPVKAGDPVVLYATGLGPVSPPVAEGLPAPSDPISLPISPIEVTIQGKKARVAFAGLAPGFAGVFQLNVYVPDGVTADPSAPLIVSAGGQPSPIVTLALTQ